VIFSEECDMTTSCRARPTREAMAGEMFPGQTNKTKESRLCGLQWWIRWQGGVEWDQAQCHTLRGTD